MRTFTKSQVLVVLAISCFEDFFGESEWSEIFGPKLNEISGCLALLEFNRLSLHNQIKLWKLKDYQDQVWIDELISLPDWVRSHRSIPICTIQTGEILFITTWGWGFNAPLWVPYYDQERKTFWRVEVKKCRIAHLPGVIEAYLLLAILKVWFL